MLTVVFTMANNNNMCPPNQAERCCDLAGLSVIAYLNV